MKLQSFEHYRDSTQEIGFVERFSSSLVEVRGLPGVTSGEMVLFESGAMGQVLSFDKERVRVLVLTSEDFAAKPQSKPGPPGTESYLAVGDEVVRMDEGLSVTVGKELLGTVIDPLGRKLDGSRRGRTSENSEYSDLLAQASSQISSESQTIRNSESLSLRSSDPLSLPSLLKTGETRLVDQTPLGISKRKGVSEPLHTGVTMVDFLVPLARGQRELVIGDRKSGKSRFVLSALKTQVNQGAIGVFTLIGKKAADIKRVEAFLREHKLADRVVVVATQSSDPSGLIFVTPFTAMTVAEYFRDQGEHVVVVLDDLTTHAKFYREVMLLASRFPGRNSYPGDVFHAQARIVERAGVFAKGTISLLPVAETVQGNLTGYIQTNLMAMTDGHLFFDSELYDRGRRPAVNPFLSVTRVGLAPQPAIFKSLQRELMQLLVRLRRIEEFVHFGGETGAHVQTLTSLGERLRLVLEESKLTEDGFLPKELKAYLLAQLWANVWKDEEGQISDSINHKSYTKTMESTEGIRGLGVSTTETARYLQKMAEVVRDYQAKPEFKAFVEKLMSRYPTFAEVVEAVRVQSLLHRSEKCEVRSWKKK